MDTAEAVAQEEEATRPTDAAAKTNAPDMFKFSRFIHVGPGAEECELVSGEEFTDTCENVQHFHAWVRLPNKFQHKDIRDKAMAAKARRVRALKDPESDPSAVLDAEMLDLRTVGDLDLIVDELMAKDWAADYLDATGVVGEREEFVHIDADRERYSELHPEMKDRPEEERSEEFRELEKQLGLYAEAITAEVDSIKQPKHDALKARPRDELVDMLREQRIDLEGDKAYVHTYNTWMWYIGTLKILRDPALRVPTKRIFANQEGMWSSAPEVVTAIEEAFTELDRALQGATQGNS